MGKPDAVERLTMRLKLGRTLIVDDVDLRAVLAYVAELERDVAKLQRFPFEKICLVCGAPKPCELANDELSPCTFDRTPKEMHDDLKQLRKRVAELEGARKTDLDELLYVARNRFRDLGHRCEYRVRFEAIKQSLEAKAAALTGGEKGRG